MTLGITNIDWGNNGYVSNLRGTSETKDSQPKQVQNSTDKFDYSKNDGIISTEDKLKNFGKGLIKPVTDMFSSTENFLKTTGMIAAGTALTIATGGAILPVLVATGVAMGGLHIVKNANIAAKAKTDKEAIEAWQGIGEGTFVTGLSIAGAKTSLKSVNTEGINPLKATAECFKKIPTSIKKSVNSFTSGEYKTNLGLKPKHYKEYTITREISVDEMPEDVKAELIRKGLL